MYVSRFVQNTEEIGENDDGVEVTSQNVATEEVRLEEQVSSSAIVEPHAPEEDVNHVAEGDAQILLLKHVIYTLFLLIKG